MKPQRIASRFPTKNQGLIMTTMNPKIYVLLYVFVIAAIHILSFSKLL